MMKISIFGICFAVGASTYAQVVNLKGIVTNPSGKRIAGAIVSLSGLGLRDTTGTDGSYALAQSSSTGIGTSKGTANMAIRNGVLEFIVRDASPVRLALLDASGRILRSEMRDDLAPGAYQWELAGNPGGNGLRIVRVSIGGQVTTLRYLPLSSAIAASSGRQGTASGLARLSASVDTLKVSASGYVSTAIALSSYQQTLNASLDSAYQLNAGMSAGCGKALSLKTGYYKITSSGTVRDYAIDIPASYNPKRPYRLVYCSHWIYADDSDIVNGAVANGGSAWAFYGLKHQADSTQDSAIFIAPSALSGIWGEVDHALFDTLLHYAKTNFCIDTTRVFATGFSYGSMMTYSLSLSHQSQLRAVACEAAANYNIYLPTDTKKPIAYLGMVGMSDTRCPYTAGLACAKTHATDNGCTVPDSVTHTNAGSKTHVIYDFSGCKNGYPVRFVSFDGGHIAAPVDGGTSDNGATTWAPRLVWKFFTQF